MFRVVVITCSVIFVIILLGVAAFVIRWQQVSRERLQEEKPWIKPAIGEMQYFKDAYPLNLKTMNTGQI